MAQVTFELESPLAEKLERFMRLFGNNELMFSKFIEYHREHTQCEIANLQAEIDSYEQRYAMDSATFYAAFERGDLSDEKDYMLWAGVYEMQQASKKRLAALS